MSSHVELVVECARARPDPQTIHRLLRKGPVWPEFLSFAARHDLQSLCYWRLKPYSEYIPAEIFDFLHAHFRGNAERNLLMTRELFRVLDTLASGGVPVAAFKGPVTAWRVYETPGMREFTDLDLLVHAEDVAAARRLLASSGYRAAADIPGGGETRLHRFGGQIELVSDSPRIVVDLHWDLAPRSLGLSLSAAELWPLLTTVPIAGKTVQSFDDSTQLLLSALHGGKHGWTTLAWLADIAAILERGAVDWDRVLDAARREHLSRVLHLAVCLVCDVLGAPLPDSIADQAHSDHAALAMAREARSFLLEGPAGEALFPRKLVYQIRITEGRRRQLHVLWDKIREPNLADWESLPVRPSLFGMYSVARPFRLLAKYLRLMALRLWNALGA